LPCSLGSPRRKGRLFVLLALARVRLREGEAGERSTPQTNAEKRMKALSRARSLARPQRELRMRFSFVLLVLKYMPFDRLIDGARAIFMCVP